MTQCGHQCTTFEQPNKAVVSEYRCRRWTCETCAPLRAWLLRMEARRGNPKRFVTLTLPSSFANDPDRGAQLLVHAWRMIVQQHRRKHGRHSLDYLCVFETTKAGTPHLHILTRGSYIAQRWLSAMMKKQANAPIVDVRRVRNKREAACYVAKYISKAPQRFVGCKRYWKTQQWTQRTTCKHYSAFAALAERRTLWATIEEAADEYIANGYRIAWLNERRFSAQRAPPPRADAHCYLPKCPET